MPTNGAPPFPNHSFYRKQNTVEPRYNEGTRDWHYLFAFQWNLDIKNLCITKPSVKRTIFFTQVVEKYMGNNLDTTKGQGTGIICSL